MNSEQVISLYESVCDLTGQMLHAAQERDWENLAALESHCAGHISTLKAGEPEALALPEALRARKVKIIHQILRYDREIRDLTSPWMADLTALLNGNGIQRRAAQAYGDMSR
jgi:flagellar protein FliT